MRPCSTCTQPGRPLPGPKSEEGFAAASASTKLTLLTQLSATGCQYTPKPGRPLRGLEIYSNGSDSTDSGVSPLRGISCNNILYYTILHYTILYYTTLHYTTLYYTLLLYYYYYYCYYTIQTEASAELCSPRTCMNRPGAQELPLRLLLVFVV